MPEPEKVHVTWPDLDSLVERLATVVGTDHHVVATDAWVVYPYKYGK